ncbi:TonB-dependent receptor [Persicobacter psychrovividus]|uniref:TonB-dependent receptor n=1 Tax=Persicobacter psychrovividus TaxID=387638 RepID=A0ABM7VFH2_9BACT|nr:TonB-dependent receptor [Persicobacter psychrovividus]
MKQLLLLFSLFLSHQIFAQHHAIKGQVLDHDTKTPLIGVVVYINDGQLNTLTDLNGRYNFPEVPDGHHTVFASYLGYLPSRKNINLHQNHQKCNFMLEPEIRELEQVIINAEEIERRRKQSQTITEISEEELEKQRGSTFVDALTKQAGINSLSTGVGISKPVIRGMFGNRVIVNDGGVKQESQQWGSDHGLPIDNYNSNSVEIIKGPASLLYGSDGIGGVVKISLAKVPTLNSFHGQFTTNYQSNNDAIGSGLKISGNHHGYYFIAEGSYTSFNNYRVPADQFEYLDFIFPIKEQTLVNTNGHDQSVGLQVGTAKKWGRLNLAVSDFQQTVGLFPGAVGTPSFGWLDDFPISSRWPELPMQVNRHQKAIFTADLKLNDDWLKITLGLQQNNRQERSRPEAHPADHPEYRSPGDVAHGLNLRNYSAEALYNHQREGFNWSIGMGGNFQQHHFDGFEFLLPNYINTSVYATTFFQKDLNEKWSLSGGLRYDLFAYQVEQFNDSSRYSPGQNSGYWINRSPHIDRTEGNWSGAIGLSYRPSEQWTAKVNFGKTFRMPTVAELTMNGVHHGTFRHEQGDASLQEERGYQIDLGLAFSTEQWHVELSPFFNYFENYIFLGPSGRFSPLPDAGQIYDYKEAEAIHAGAEFSVNYQPTNYLSFSNAFEYLYNLNLDTNLPLPFTPPASNYVEFSYHWRHRSQFEDLYIGAGHRATAAQNRVDRNERTTPGYQLINLHAGMKICMPHVQYHIMLKVDNLTNQTYMNHLSRYRLLNLPEQGRNISLTVKMNF